MFTPIFQINEPDLLVDLSDIFSTLFYQALKTDQKIFADHMNQIREQIM